MSEMTDHDVQVDARQLACPLPLLKAKMALKSISSGQIMRVLATDPTSQRDLTTFVNMAGHEMVETNLDSGVYSYLIRKA